MLSGSEAASQERGKAPRSHRERHARASGLGEVEPGELDELHSARQRLRYSAYQLR